jgi:hypothetical protein
LWHIPHALNVERIGKEMRLSWPATGSNFVLECSAELPGTNWIEVPQPPVLVDDQLVVTNSLDGDSRFYRLLKK